MTSISKNVFIDKLDDIVDGYNNTHHRTMNLFWLYCWNIVKDPKFEVGDHVRVSKYKNIFAKCYTPNWSEEVFNG